MNTRNFKIRCKGGAVVEFALVLPLLLLLILGVVEYGVAMYNKAIITNASREAARAAIVYKSPKLTDTQIKAVATSYLSSGGKSLLLTFGTAATPTVVPTHSTNATLGSTEVSVKVTYAYSGFVWTPAIAKLVNTSSSLPAAVTLSATSVMVDE